jgi:hypothetical protein
MPKQETVLVERIKFPHDRRSMTLVSAKSNAKQWRIVGEEQEPVKKKHVEPVQGKVIEQTIAKLEAPEIVPDIKPETITEDDFINPTQELTQKEVLQSEYEAKTGTKPDGRWSEKKLTEELTKTK